MVVVRERVVARRERSSSVWCSSWDCRLEICFLRRAISSEGACSEGGSGLESFGSVSRPQFWRHAVSPMRSGRRLPALTWRGARRWRRAG